MKSSTFQATQISLKDRLELAPYSVLLLGKLSLAMMLMSCQGGERLTNFTYGNSLQEVMVDGEPMDGEPMGGELMGGELMGGELMGGELMGGEPMAGEPMAGEPMAGEPMAGELNDDCGLYAVDSVEIFSRTPLNTLATNCATVGCHNSDSFRQFKLRFNTPENRGLYSDQQVQEGLQAVGDHLILGDGVGSQISRRIIDQHSMRLSFDADSMEYLSMVDWIDRIPVCIE